MAWTNPKTWVASETITANDLNLNIKDNLNFLYGGIKRDPLNLVPGQLKQYWSPVGNASTVVTQVGIAVAASGTATARAVAATNNFTSRSRLGYSTGATAGTAAGIRANSNQFIFRDQELIRMRFQFGISVNPLNRFRGFFGFTGASTANQPNTTFTSTTAYPNLFGVGFDDQDTTLKIYTNDAVGAPTAINTGLLINVINTNWFHVELSISDSGLFKYWIYNIADDAFEQGFVISDVPANDTFLGWRMQIVNTAAVNYGFDLGEVSVEAKSKTNSWPEV
jgi:hypothetical protein